MVIPGRIIRIRNSRGLRLPRQVLEQTGLADDVELDVREDHIVIRRAVRRPGAGWDEQFRGMAERGDDRLLDADAPTGTTWDETDWE